MKEVQRLINSKILEKNDICFTLSLFSHHYEDNTIGFSLYSDYLGFAMKELDENYLGDKLNIPRFGQILAGNDILQKAKLMTNDEYLKEIRRLIEEMDKLTIEDVIKLIEN